MGNNNDEELFCGSEESSDLCDDYYNDYIVSIDDVDFELDGDENDEED